MNASIGEATGFPPGADIMPSLVSRPAPDVSAPAVMGDGVLREGFCLRNRYCERGSRRLPRLLAPLAIVAAIAMGCSGSSPPSAPAEARLARLDISYFPDPAVGSPAPNRAPGFVTRVELRIRDLGGVGVELARIEAGVSSDPGSLVALEISEIVARAGSSRVESRGLLVVPVEIAYEGEDRVGDVQVVMSGTDDLGNVISYNGGLPIRYTGQ